MTSPVNRSEINRWELPKSALPVWLNMCKRRGVSEKFFVPGFGKYCIGIFGILDFGILGSGIFYLVYSILPFQVLGYLFLNAERHRTPVLNCKFFLNVFFQSSQDNKKNKSHCSSRERFLLNRAE